MLPDDQKLCVKKTDRYNQKDNEIKAEIVIVATKFSLIKVSVE